MSLCGNSWDEFKYGSKLIRGQLPIESVNKKSIVLKFLPPIIESQPFIEYAIDIGRKDSFTCSQRSKLNQVLLGWQFW